MREISITDQSHLTAALAEEHRKMWNAYMAVDEATHNEFMTDDYWCVDPNGTIHKGRPSAREIAATPIDGYWLHDLEARSLASDTAFVTYKAEVQIRSTAELQTFRFAVGELWRMETGRWKCFYYQATMLQ